MKKKKAQPPKKKAKAAPRVKTAKPAKVKAKIKAPQRPLAPFKSATQAKAGVSPVKLSTKDLLLKSSNIALPPDYRPSDKEPFMHARQLEYFRRKLLSWRVELLKESEETLESLQEGSLQEPDIADRASAEMERALELRTRDRARKLITKIDSALRRVEDGTYGFCEETGEPIGLKRLEARPIATLSVEAQERHERMERTHRSD